jgi:hypothetical protein
VINLEDPAAVADELRRRGLEVHRSSTVIGTDARLAEIFSSARRGGWTKANPVRARYVNRGRLLAALEGEA